MSAPATTAHDGLRLGRLWSLWDMINFQVLGLVGWLQLLEQEKHVASQKGQIMIMLAAHQLDPEKVPPADYQVTEQDRQRLSGFLEYGAQLSRQLHLTGTENRLVRFRQAMGPQNSITPVTVGQELKTLHEAVQDDLHFKYFYFYQDDKAKHVLQVASDWLLPVSAFPSAKSEIEDAVDCWALEKPTAAIFHLMRVAEYGLRALARERKVTLPKGKPVEWGTWQEIIRGIKDSAEQIAKTKRAGAGKDEALAFYNSAVAHFDAFKDTYRNTVMHVRKRYDMLDAERALIHVRDFMGGLSGKVGENTKGPIKWKL